MLELPGDKKIAKRKRLLVALMLVLFLGAVFFFVTRDEEVPEEVVDKVVPEKQEVVIPSEPEFLSLLPDEAHKLVQERNVVIVDVRSEAERGETVIPGSISVPLSKLAAGEFDLPKEQAILLVCAVGGRSYGAGLYLMQQGYLQVYNLRGGIVAWAKNGLPLEAGQAAVKAEAAEKNGSPAN